jgi:hypothetical protein
LQEDQWAAATYGFECGQRQQQRYVQLMNDRRSARHCSGLAPSDRVVTGELWRAGTR